MGKHSGYSLYWNLVGEGETKLVSKIETKLVESDWRATKASAKRRVEVVFECITKHPGTPLVVLAVDPDTGEVIAGKMEVEK